MRAKSEDNKAAIKSPRPPQLIPSVLEWALVVVDFAPDLVLQEGRTQRLSKRSK